MRRHLTNTNSARTAILVGTAMLFWSAIAFAGTPSLGANCGVGASIVGSDSAGKVTLGASQNECTLTFSVPYPNAPACMTTNETQGRAVGVSTTVSGAVLSGPYPFAAGDVIAYVCQDY
jgi:hypothetical protein